MFQIVPPTKKDVAIHVSKILKNEGIAYAPKDLVPIVESAYPDIRKTINICQYSSIDGEFRISTESILENDYKMKVIEILKSTDDKRKKYANIRQVIIDSKVTDFTDLYTLLYEKVDEYAPNNPNVILLISDGLYKCSLCVDKEIPTAATLINILNEI
jgi:DNA polymerase III delta prime subunit